MDFAYTFSDPTTLYLNVTNRCTNRCIFCVSRCTAGLGDGILRGSVEPDATTLLDAITSRGGSKQFQEIVWCGFGEPTFRLDLILEVSELLRTAGATLRLNTNGHGNLIHGANILPALGDVLDTVSISLNAPTEDRYVALCDPDPDAVFNPTEPEAFFAAVLDSLQQAPRWFPNVRASVVGAVLDTEEIAACRQLAAGYGVNTFIVR